MNLFLSVLLNNSLSPVISLPMKFGVTLVLIAGILLTFAGVLAQDFSYTTNIDNTVTIAGYAGSGGAVVIPSEIDGLQVIRIDRWAFSFCSNLTEIIISDTVRSIGDKAFDECVNLSSISIPGSVTNVGDKTFSHCPNLRALYFEGHAPVAGSSVFVGSENAVVYYMPETTGWGETFCTRPVMPFPYTFMKANGAVVITEYTDSESVVPVPSAVYGLPVKTIWDATFLQCASLSRVIIPDSVDYIGTMVFAGCTNLQEIVLSDNVTNIGFGAFAFCASLTNVVVGSGVSYIDDNAFYSCLKLGAITVDPLNQFYRSVDGVLYSFSPAELICCPAGKTSRVDVPDGITGIRSSGFSLCTNVTSITLPDSLNYVRENAFSYCISLSEIYFKGDAPSVATNAFPGATNSVVYYLPGKRFWSFFPTFGGRPTALWQPQMRNLNVSGCFGFDMNWAEGMTVVVEVCTNLTSGLWKPLETNVLTSSSAHFHDPQWTNYPELFYRLRMP